MTDPRSASRAPSGIPQPPGAPAPIGSPVQAIPSPPPRKRRALPKPPISVRARVSASLLVFLDVCGLVDYFVMTYRQDAGKDFSLFNEATRWALSAPIILLIVLEVVFLVRRGKVARYTVVGIHLINFLILRPLISGAYGMGWYGFLFPPRYFGGAAASYLRAWIMWFFMYIIVVAVICLAIPDRRSKGGASSIDRLPAGGFPAGQVPQPAQGLAVPPVPVPNATATAAQYRAPRGVPVATGEQIPQPPDPGPRR